jgi:hypothetical protein
MDFLQLCHRDGDMKTWTIDHPHNEASALLGIQNSLFLESRGWETGFWIVSDEREASKALAALGRSASGEWEVVRVQTRGGSTKKCEDCETISRAGSRVYIFGSQYGTKEGPLEPKRHFIARFDEAMVDVSDKPSVKLDLVRRPFAIHRLVNDALREAGVELRPLEQALHDGFADVKKKWKELVREDDQPVNLEGSTFLEGGRLLLGLRHPVTADGHPILVEVEGIDRLFEEDAAPPMVLAVRIISNAGDERRPAGIRELDSRGGTVHAVTGALDDELLGGHARVHRARSEHWCFRYEYGSRGLQKVEATRIRAFTRLARVEGLALDGTNVWYVHDDQQIRLERAPLRGN